MSHTPLNTQILPPLLPLAYDACALTGVLREHPEYFFVEERLGFDPEGEGEHVFLLIEKTGLNTQFVADRLATIANVAKHQVSYSGMKDKNAVTRQWFSVHLPGNKNIDWTVLNSESVSVLKSVRHRKKLRRGVHRANFFRIKLTEIQGDIRQLESRLTLIARDGVPNYFGEQRFGRNGSNLLQAQKWFAGEFSPKRHQRGIYLSAARAFIFNCVLADRVNDHCWNTLQSDESIMLDGSHSVFTSSDDDLSERLRIGDIHPTGPMYGKTQATQKCGDYSARERHVFMPYSFILNGLINAGLKHERRALRIIPQEFSWQVGSDTIELSFELHSGCFATSLIRELLNYKLVA